MPARTADPYRDTDVIDATAPRFTQAFIGTLAVVAIVTGWWVLYALLALQLLVGLTLGRKWCLPCFFYFEVVQPRRGEVEVEDARPPRFANMVGFAVLSGAALAHALGAPTVGTALGGLVATLALLAAATGLCVGCEMYRLIARMRGIRAGADTARIDLSELAAGPPADEAVVLFTHPLCTGCRELEHRLREEGRPTVRVDVSQRPELARKYGIAIVPRAFAVDGAGKVLSEVA